MNLAFEGDYLKFLQVIDRAYSRQEWVRVKISIKTSSGKRIQRILNLDQDGFQRMEVIFSAFLQTSSRLI